MGAIDYKYIGKRIRAERKKMALTQEQLAELADISHSFLGHIERGTRKMSLETAFVLADVLDLSLDAMLGTQFEYPYYGAEENDIAQELMQAILNILRKSNMSI